MESAIPQGPAMYGGDLSRLLLVDYGVRCRMSKISCAG